MRLRDRLLLWRLRLIWHIKHRTLHASTPRSWDPNRCPQCNKKLHPLRLPSFKAQFCSKCGTVKVDYLLSPGEFLLLVNQYAALRGYPKSEKALA